VTAKKLERLGADIRGEEEAAPKKNFYDY